MRGHNNEQHESASPLLSYPPAERITTSRTSPYADTAEVLAIPTSPDGTSSPVYVHTPQTYRSTSSHFSNGSNKRRRAHRDVDEEECDCCSCCCGCCSNTCSRCVDCVGTSLHRVGLTRYTQSLWCVKDVCGLFCAVFTWLLIFYAQFVSLRILLASAPSWWYRWINGPIFHVCSTLAFVSHVRAMFTDPGTVPLNNATRENILRMGLREGQVVYKCPKCCSIKPERAHHCSVCRRCIRKMDHHCPWVNNCVGEANQKYFVLFTAYICFISFYAIYMCVHYFIMCLKSDWHECRDNGFSPAANTIFIVFLIVEGILFGLFTAVMFGDQMQAIWNDTTGIESLKKERGTWERRSKWLSMEVVFGHPCNWRWLLPIPPHSSQTYRKVWPLHDV